MISFRLLRRRSFLAFIFVCSLIYFITSIYRQSLGASQHRQNPEDDRPTFSLANFNWNSRHVNTSEDVCKNSVQGRDILVDDKGFVCSRDSLNIGGCCLNQSARYVCDSCRRNGCCAVYEHCVSCCLHPEKLPLMKRIVGQMTRTYPHVFAPVTNFFEFCLTKCRTSSLSVLHENSYRNSVLKHCFANRLPDIQPDS